MDPFEAGAAEAPAWLMYPSRTQFEVGDASGAGSDQEDTFVVVIARPQLKMPSADHVVH